MAERNCMTGNCRFRWLALGTFVLSLALVSGCGSSDWGEVTGTVRVNGQPVGPGSMNLEPVEPGKPGAVARFAEDGRYAVISSGNKKGARVGQYRVSIIGGAAGDEIVDPNAKGKIPAKYGNSATSNLTLTVEPGSKEQDFDLKP
jgi:hypothetical protein